VLTRAFAKKKKTGLGSMGWDGEGGERLRERKEEGSGGRDEEYSVTFKVLISGSQPLI